MLPRRLWFVIGTLCVSGLLANTALSHTAYRLPLNITADATLEDVIARMLERSPTFREQIDHLGSIRHLRVQLMMRLSREAFGQATFSADCNMRRYRFGRIEATVRLLSRGRAVELIAHELEHVREYVTGTDFRVLATRQGSGVWDTGSGHFETARAVAVGRRVAAEAQTRTTASY